MSAFIVNDSTINRVVTLAQYGRMDEGFAFKRAGYDFDKDNEAAERLARDLHLLNCDAVDCRYGKGTAAGDVAVCFQYRTEFAPPLQVYKNARCLRYQCAEGDVVKRPLFAALERFCANLADRIINQLPDYEKIKWE